MIDSLGGVTRFWADIKANLRPTEYEEFAQQPGVYPSSLGIGLVLTPPALPFARNSTFVKTYAALRELVPSMGKSVSARALEAKIVKSAQARGS